VVKILLLARRIHNAKHEDQRLAGFDALLDMRPIAGKELGSESTLPCCEDQIQ
jgi:hypothetical protein